MAYISEPFDPPRAPVLPKREPVIKTRYASIDALKGLSILSIWIIFAWPDLTTIPAAFRLSKWGQPGLADCVAPALIFAIGAGLPLFAAHRQDRDSIGRFLIQASSRAFWLILFGIVLDSVVAQRPDIELGSLQLIGIAYLVNALFARTPIVLRAFLAEGLLLGFYVWAKMSHVPGAPPGTFNESVNYISYFNDHVLAPNGWHDLLTVVPIISIMMSGSVIGSLYLLDDSRYRRGLIFMAVGGTLAFFGWLWSLEQPMAASIMTSSFSLFATGVVLIALGVLNVPFDSEKGRAIAYPIIIPGTSIILAIVGPVILRNMILDVWTWPGTDDTINGAYQKWIASTFSVPLKDWVYPITWVFLWWCILAITYHRRQWLRAKCEN